MTHIPHPFIFALIFTLSSTISLAETADDNLGFPPSSSIAISAGKDSDQNQNRQLQLNIELKKFQQINIGYGDSTSSTNLLNATQYYIGASTNPYDVFSAGIEFSQWGKSNSLEIKSLRMDFSANTDNWGFSLAPQMNIVSIYANNGKAYDIKSRGLSVSSTYYGFDAYFLSVNFLLNKVTSEANFLESSVLKELALSRIPVSAQQLISGLEKKRAGLSLGRFFSWGSIGLDWTQSEAELIDETFQTYSFIIDYQLSKHFSINIISSQQTANSSISNDTSPLYAIDLGLSANW